MTRLNSSDPDVPLRLPLLRTLQAAVHTGIERSVPIPALIRLRVHWLKGLEDGPTDLAGYVACQEALLRERPCGLSAEAAAHLCYAVWHLAVRTYAPVFRRSRPWLLDVLQPRGLEHLDAVRQAGTGCVVVGAHMGLFAWVDPILWGLGYPVMMTARKHMTDDVIYQALRDGLADRRLPFGKAGQGTVQLKRLHEMLEGGAWLRHTGDVADPERGLRGHIFGRPVRLVRAPWVLSQTTGTPVVPVIVPVGADLKPRLHVGAPIYVAPGPDGRAACEQAVQRYLDFLADAAGDAAWNFHPRVWAPWFAQSAADSTPVCQRRL